MTHGPDPVLGDSDTWFLPVTCASGWTAYVAGVRFEAAKFEDSDFALARIECPVLVSRSVVKRRAEFLNGRIAARAALRRMGMPDRPIAVGPDRAPVWPAGIVGSITHCASVAAAVTATREEAYGLGIDVEAIDRSLLDPTIHAQVVSQDEIHTMRRALRNQSAAARSFASSPASCGLPFKSVFDTHNPWLQSSNEQPIDFAFAVTAVFSAKESFFKAVFPICQGFLEFNAVRVLYLDLARGEIGLALTRTLGPTLQARKEVVIQMVRLGRALILTLCHIPSELRPAH